MTNQVSVVESVNQGIVATDSFIGSMNAMKKMMPDLVKKNDSFHVHPSLLAIRDGFNVRDYSKYEDHIESLAQQWLDNPAMIPPLMVTFSFNEGKCYIIDGHCRRIALARANSRGAEIERVPVVLFSGTEDELDAVILKSQQNAKLSPVEESIVYKRMALRGRTNQEISTILRVSLQQVTNMLKLAELPTVLKDMVRNKTISYATMLQLCREHNDDFAKIEQLIVAEVGAQGEGETEAKKPRRFTARSMNKNGVNFTKTVKAQASTVLTRLIGSLQGEGEQVVSLDAEMVTLLMQIKASMHQEEAGEPKNDNQLELAGVDGTHPHDHLIVTDGSEDELNVSAEMAGATV